MSSQVVIKDKKHTGGVSRMAKAISGIAGNINTSQDGLFNQKVTIKTDNLTISNDNLDCEFTVPFDDDTEANEAEIIVYNLTSSTIKQLSKGDSITITAGYGNDTGVIFSGFITKIKTYYENNDKITEIMALDSEDREERDIESKTFAAKTKASTILKYLVSQLGLPIAAFAVARDYTYKDSVTVDGGIMDAIKQYAKVCGVVTYVCKSKVYVCPIDFITDQTFDLSADTGLLSTSEFEETQSATEYKDTIQGYECKMLLQHKVQTGSIVTLKTKNVKGSFRVREGTHEYDGNNFTTTVKAIKV